MPFKDWYYNEDNAEHLNNVPKAEQEFEDVVGVLIPSLKSFISWLILKREISGSVKLKNRKKPVSIMSLPEEKQIHHLVKKLKKLDELAKDFNKSFGNLDKNGERIK